MNARQLASGSPEIVPFCCERRIFGAGEMAALIRKRDWSLTPLGPMHTWSEALTTAVNLMLASPLASSLYWGPLHVLLYNDAYRLFTAARHPVALGQPGSHVWKEAWHIVGPQIEHTFNTGESFHREGFLVPIEHDGQMVDHYWNYSFSPVFDAVSGGIAGVYNTSANATDAVITATERDQLARRLQQVLESTNDGVVSIDRSWRLTYINDRARQIHAPLKFVLGNTLWEALPALVEGTPAFSYLHRAMNHNEPGEFELNYPVPLHHCLHVQVRPTPDGIVVFLRDITGQKQTASALKKAVEDLAASEEDLRWTVALSVQIPWTASPDGTILSAGDFVQELTGHPSERMAGNSWIALMHPEDAQRMQQVWGNCVETGVPYDIEHRVQTTTGQMHWFRSRAFPRRDSDGTIVKWYGNTEDINARKQAAVALEQGALALAASEEELRWTVQLSVQLPWTAAPDGELLSIGNRWFELTGIPREQVLGENWINVQHPDDVADLLAAWSYSVAAGQPLDCEHRIKTWTGEWCWMRSRAFPRRDENGAIVKWYGTTEDVQGRKTAEEAVRTTEKLAAVGRLATSIAHEINNPLEAVTNLLYLARTSGDLPEMLAYIKNAEEELHRASVITNQTLRFQRQSSAPIALDSEDLIENCLAVFSGKLQNSSVMPERRLRAGRAVTCYDGEIRQVFLNLVGNAIDAMQPTGGRLLIRTREATHPVNGKRGVVLTIADTGAGIAPEVRKKIFDPFFTTKGLGGTGLGLWVTQDIVARHHGSLRLRSRTRRRRTDFANGEHQSGTVFTLFLPFEAALRHAAPTVLLDQHAAVAA